jgi:hypothetical protein
MGGSQSKDCQLSTRFSQLRQSKEQSSETCGIEFPQVAAIQGHTQFSSRYQPVQLRPKVQILLPDDELTMQIDNPDAFRVSGSGF